MKQLWKRVEDFINRLIPLKHLPLTARLFVLSAILVIIPMLAVGTISYHRSSQELEIEARQYNLQLIEQVKTHIEYYLHDFEVEALKIVNDPDMITFLGMRSIEEVEQSSIRNSVQNLLKKTAYSRPDITNITVMTENLQVIDSLGSLSPYPAAELKNEYWYSSVPVNGSPMLISRVTHWPDRKEPVISLVKRMHSPRTLEPVGMLIIDINFRRLQEIADKVTFRKNEDFYIVDFEGHYVYHPQYLELGKKAKFDNVDLLLLQDNGSFVTDNQAKRFVTFSVSPSLNWRFVTSIPYSDLTKGVAHIGQTIFWTVLIALGIAYMLGASFTSSFVRPIKRLQRSMKNVETGNFTEQVLVESKDEIGQLSDGFNKMVKKISNLLDEVYVSKLRETEALLRQKEMELKVLQSQINPHFLYNSLETIRGMALDQNLQDIATMASSLSLLLRYNLQNHSPTVTLGEEVKFCDVYLQIQQFRFEGMFDYEFVIPDWAKDLQIVKFSLQPLVENCFVHGLRSHQNKLLIGITVAQDTDNTFEIKAADNGKGITKDALEKIVRDLKQKDATEGGANLGIVNVHRRIVHLFGTEYGVRIDSKEGQGTNICIRLPIIRESIGGETG